MDNVFWDAFTEACSARNTSPTAVVKALGLSSGSPTAWKRGTVPNAFTIASVAQFLDWPMQKFYGLAAPEQKERQPSDVEGLSEDEIRLIKAYREISETDKPVYLQILTRGAEHTP